MDLTKRQKKKLFRLGHFFSPEALCFDLVTKDDLEKLSSDDPVVRAAVRSWQSWFVGDIDMLSERIHSRKSIADGETGPATNATFKLPRCGLPDYYSPNKQAAAEEANWPEACRRNITTSYKMSLSGLSDAKLAELWQEADMNWEKEFDIHFEFQPDNYPNTRIYSFEAALGGSVLADQFLATNDCSYRSRGRFDNRTWNDVLFVTTCTHEHGHALGLPHVNDSAATMYPSITNTSMGRRGKPNQSDIQNMLSRGYKRRTEPPLPPPGDGEFKIVRDTITHVKSGDSIKLRFIEAAGFV